MLVADTLLVTTLRRELELVRRDPGLQDDLLEFAEPATRAEVLGYLCDQRHPVEVRLGYPVEPPRAPLIAVLMAGETEVDQPLDLLFAEYDAPDDPAGLRVRYRGAATAAVAAVRGGQLQLVAWRETARVDEAALDLQAYPTLAALAAAVPAPWEATADAAVAGLAPARLVPQAADVLRGEALSAEGRRRLVRRGTWLAASWKIVALAPNATVATWLQAFVKWALLRRRGELQQQGLVSQQLAGGDFEPVPEALPDFLYARGTMLHAQYAVTYIETLPSAPLAGAAVQPRFAPEDGP